MRDKMTMLILSCDAFSDLWDGHVKLLEKNWSDRNVDTYIVTEGEIDKSFENVKLFKAGSGLEWSERFEAIMSNISTEYVFVTLDDYFLIHPVNTSDMKKLLSIMDQKLIDYMRLYPRPKRATRNEVDKGSKINWVDSSTKYSVNLYSAVWRTDFLRAMLKKKKNAWQFEVGLSKDATQYGAKCAVSHNNEFQILDVVRKGKLLHKSASYFKQHPELYAGSRKVQPWTYEIKLWIKTMVGRHTPLWLHNFIRKVMKKMGYHFISDDVGE